MEYVSKNHRKSTSSSYILIDIIRRFVETYLIFDDLIYQIFIKYGRKLCFPYSNPEHDDAIYVFTYIFFARSID